ncbi:MAG TPA: methionine gamma-lyase [Bacteroidales bacterium]|nr:MAG: methionine gamma-lyase [Bacteroidetes bacterium GWE2_42_24]OFY31539.1 MAG: methionine gamma-lyase [Bacteroidetes bacterium GWF2_43_11]HAQ65748.1 methionine gamma-lyase [Bacteroidales bacterium]HBZ67211.1 methionine gamma-lyase [Bacteroidales bacterium]
METKNSGFNSKLIHEGGIEDERGSAVTPIYQTSTFKFKNAAHGARLFAGEEDGFIYTRLGNPTIRDLEVTVAALEHGAGAVACASGMGAVTTVYMTYLGAGAHMVGHEAVYGPSRVVMETLFAKFGVQSTFVDTSDLKKVEAAIRPETKLIYLETPANPTMTIADIPAIVELAHSKGIMVCIDNTFCSPYLQNPILMGADVVLHSMTKFINGHADIVGGIVIAKEAVEVKKIRGVMTNMGCNMDPHQAFLTRRGLKTLGIRIDRAQENALKVAEYLEKHPKVDWVLYPGLKSHPQYELGKRQMKGPGSMISFGVKGGFDAGSILMDNVKMMLLAVSLGGIESLIQHPASMTHSKISKANREMAGISDGLIRLSVGIEDVEDIISDLSQALNRI